MNFLSSRQKSFLWRYASKCTISLSFQQGFLNAWITTSPQFPATPNILTFATDVWHSMMLAAAGCRLLLLADGQRNLRGSQLPLSLSCVDSGEVSCLSSWISVTSEAAAVGALLRSVVKLFLLERKLIGVYLLEISSGQTRTCKTCIGLLLPGRRPLLKRTTLSTLATTFLPMSLRSAGPLAPPLRLPLEHCPLRFFFISVFTDACRAPVWFSSTSRAFRPKLSRIFFLVFWLIPSRYLPYTPASDPCVCHPRTLWAGLVQHAAKPGTAPRIGAVCTWFRHQHTRKARRIAKQTQEVAMGHAMMEWQDKTTTPRKARSHESHSAATKKCPSLLEINNSRRDTALCNAVLAQSGTDVMVPLIPWQVPGHQRLDARQSPLGASQQAIFSNTLRNFPQISKNLPTFLAKSQYNMNDECADSVRTMRWEWDRKRQETRMRWSHLREYTIVHSHCPTIFNFD